MISEARFFDSVQQQKRPDGDQEKVRILYILVLKADLNPRTFLFEVYNILVNTIGLKLRKEKLNNKANLASIEGCTIRLIETPTSGIRPMKNQEYFKEMEELKDIEGFYRKFQRWFIGFNWRALSII